MATQPETRAGQSWELLLGAQALGRPLLPSQVYESGAGSEVEQQDWQQGGDLALTVPFLSLQFLARLTERFVLGVDMFVETLWKMWTELLDVLGLDGRCQSLPRGPGADHQGEGQCSGHLFMRPTGVAFSQQLFRMRWG